MKESKNNIRKSGGKIFVHGFVVEHYEIYLQRKQQPQTFGPLEITHYTVIKLLQKMFT